MDEGKNAIAADSGTISAGHTQESQCLNCETALIGTHCHACGQKAHIHRTMGAFLHDLLHGVLHFEGKIWRTLPMLLWHPGRLTREYIDGRRVRYVGPIALFLFTVFLTFALFSLLGGASALSPTVKGVEEAQATYDMGKVELEKLRAERATVSDDSPRAEELDKQIRDLAERQQALGNIVGAVASDFESSFREGFEANPLPAENSVSDAIGKITDNPQLTIYKLQTNAYKFSWILIPLSVPFIWLLFPFSRRFGGYDHTVFATYSISFMIMLTTVVSLLFYFNLPSFGAALMLFAPLHLYRQLRGAYALGRWGAIWRMLAISLFAWIVVGLFIGAIGLLAA